MRNTIVVNPDIGSTMNILLWILSHIHTIFSSPPFPRHILPISDPTPFTQFLQFTWLNWANKMTNPFRFRIVVYQSFDYIVVAFFIRVVKQVYPFLSLFSLVLATLLLRLMYTHTHARILCWPHFVWLCQCYCIYIYIYLLAT